MANEKSKAWLFGVPSSVLRIFSILGVFAILFYSFKNQPGAHTSGFDLRAALLVMLVPLLLLLSFERSLPAWQLMWRRLREIKKSNQQELLEELKNNSVRFSSTLGPAQLLRWSERHADSMVRYGGTLLASRFDSDEIGTLLRRRAESEDLQWQNLCSILAFLARLAPYFGMLATVIGMVQLLQNMSDFTKISGSMALAMQGTLYGLLSFTLIYSPLQKLAQSIRDEIFRRNEWILGWFENLTKRIDPLLIEEVLVSSDAGNLTSAFIKNRSEQNRTDGKDLGSTA